MVEIQEKNPDNDSVHKAKNLLNALLLPFRKGNLLEEVVEKQKYVTNFLQVMY